MKFNMNHLIPYDIIAFSDVYDNDFPSVNQLAVRLSIQILLNIWRNILGWKYGIFH